MCSITYVYGVGPVASVLVRAASLIIDRNITSIITTSACYYYYYHYVLLLLLLLRAAGSVPS